MARKMKDSGIEWIGEIPEEWEVVRLRFLCKILTGNKDTVDRNDDGQYPFYVRSPNVERIDTYSYDGEAILMAGDGVGAGKVFHYVNGKFDYHQRVYNLHEFIRVNVKCLFYYLQENFRKEIEKSNAKSTVDSIRLPMLLSFPIIITNASEQQTIADYLDQKCNLIDSTIEKQESVIEKLKLYKQSVITEAVTKGLDPNVKTKDSGIEWIGEIPEGWDVRRMKGIGEAIIGLTYSPADISEDDNGVLVLRSSNIQNGKIVLEDNVYVNKQIQDRLIAKKGDILICSRNGSRALVGKCAYIDEGSAGNSFGAFTTVFRSPFNKFIYYVLNSKLFSFHLATFLTSTINQLTTSNLNNIQVPLPGLTDQQAIADYLDTKCAQIDTLIANKQTLIDKLTEYKKSLIYECVTGKREVV